MSAGRLDSVSRVSSFEFPVSNRFSFSYCDWSGLLSSVSNAALTAVYASDILDRVTNITYRTAGGGCETRTPNAEHRMPNAEVSGQCVSDLDASGNPLRAYTWGQGIDDLLAVTVYTNTFTQSGTNALTQFPVTYYAVKDHLGSVHALVDASGQLAASYTYDAWGSVLSTSYFLPLTSYFPSFPLRYLFQGREYSFATGLYNFRARWYAPELGRWLSNDPIGISGGLNLYEFCANNPVSAIDPDGLDVVYLVDTDAVLGAGHAASAVGNDRTGWAYYSFGMGDDRNGPQHLGTRDNMTVRHYKTYEELRKDNPRYDDEICYKSSEKADMAAHREANSHFNDSYWFVGRNCDDVATAILKAAGVNFKDRLRPNASFKKNRANNEGLSK